MKSIRIALGISGAIVFVLGAFYIVATTFPPVSTTDVAGTTVTNTPVTTTPTPTTTVPTVTTTPKPTATTPKPTTTTPGGYTMAQVRAHASSSSCWTVVSGNVYDLTSWIRQHPGGSSAILRMCGVDGTVAFNEQHGGQGRPERELATFLLGPLTS